MKKLIVLAVASLFATSAVAGEMKWNGSAGWRWVSTKQSDGLESKNNTTANKDVSTLKSKAHNVRANLGVSGGWENVEWGVGVRTTSAANNDWKAVQNAGDHAAAFELAWFRYLKDFGALDINVTVGRQKNVFAYDETSQNFFDNDEKVFTGPTQQVADPKIERTKTASAVETKIIEALEEYVKPAVEQDGGAIHFKSFEDGIVTVVMKGSCSGCPSSTVTLKSGIERLLKQLVPEVNEVVAEAL